MAIRSKPYHIGAPHSSDPQALLLYLARTAEQINEMFEMLFTDTGGVDAKTGVISLALIPSALVGQVITGNGLTVPPIWSSDLLVTPHSVIAGSAVGTTCRFGEGRPCGNPTGTPTAALNGAGALTGTYKYAYYEQDPTGTGTTGLSPISAPIVYAAQQGLITVPLPRRGMGGRYLCRTKAGGSTFYQLANLNSFSFYQTIWPDNAADSTLTVLAPTVDTTVLYALELNPSGASFMRTHPDQGSTPADMSSVKGDPYTSGAYSMDNYGTMLIRASANQNAIQTQTTGTGAGNNHLVCYQLPAQNDGTGIANPGPITFSVSALGIVTAASNLTAGGYIVAGALGANAPNAGDLVVNRGGVSPGTGAIFFGSSAGAHYLYYDGTKFNITDPITVTGSVTASVDIVTGAARYFTWNGRSAMSSPADGQINLVKQSTTIGIGLDVTTDGLLQVRTRTQTGFAAGKSGASGIATTSTDGWTLSNDTVSTAGVPVQQSPRLRFNSHVWNTTAVAADNANDFWIESVPVSGLTPSGLLKVASSLNGAAATFPLTLTSSGILTALSSIVAGANLQAGSANYVTWNGLTALSSPTDGTLNVTKQSTVTGFCLDGTTDGLCKIRTRGSAADAPISMAAYTHSKAEIDTSYVYSTPLTATTITMAAGQQRAIIDPAGTIAALTVTLPSSPVDGQIAGMAFTQIVTVLTINAPGGATVAAPPASAAVDSAFRFLYRAANTTWYPSP